MKPRSTHADRRRLNVALFVPVSGSAGLWGPSAIACAELAAEEVNRAGGVAGRELMLRVFNAADEDAEVHAAARQAVHEGGAEVIVGMHTSSVRQTIERAAAGRVPFVYTPLYEGGGLAPGVFAIGERPEQQLRPALQAMVGRYRARRWLLLGNDYVWPRVSHRLARQYLEEAGAQVLDDLYLPFGVDDFAPVMDHLRRLAPDAVLLSLIGQDAVDFNRHFGDLGLARHVQRLSCAIEENTLLAIGPEHSEGLHAAAGYFATLATDANLGFKERYHARFGGRAPMLNTLGQSTYEGVHFAAALLQGRHRQPQGWASVRGTRYHDPRRSEQRTYLARADGLRFELVQAL